MPLKQEIDLFTFFRAVDQCQGTVEVTTPEGDCLNLRSQICRFLFSVDSCRHRILSCAQIQCSNSEDYALLRKYIAE